MVYYALASDIQIIFGKGLDISSNTLQALLMSKLSSKLSKAAELFEISTWNFSLTSTSSSFLRSNLSKSEFCLAR
jgi:hypothetical protein